jgi:hypothetical protein
MHSKRLDYPTLDRHNCRISRSETSLQKIKALEVLCRRIFLEVEVGAAVYVKATMDVPTKSRIINIDPDETSNSSDETVFKTPAQTSDPDPHQAAATCRLISPY